MTHWASVKDSMFAAAPPRTPIDSPNSQSFASFSVTPKLVGDAGLIGFVPAYLALDLPAEWRIRVAELPPSSTPRFDVALDWNEEVTGSAGPRRWFVDLVRRTLAGSTAPGPCG